MITRRCLLFLLAFLCQPAADSAVVQTEGTLRFHSVAKPELRLAGPVGERLRANLDQWLLCAPQANPGMIDMFRVRDRQPTPQLVPWAGEFVGKYLLSAVQALRFTDDPRLTEQVNQVVRDFIATQAEDGYLGPFPKDIRLLKNWDLWGHYHAIQALLAWSERSDAEAALQAARKAADLACRIYLDGGHRVLEAGDPEMNMAILTGVAMLYRRTGEARYLQLALEVVKDWENAGDYLRAGLDGREYFQSPRPRWESLHSLQGLLELWQITGEPNYRAAFEHHWRSIRRWDRRNTGGFSSGEQATGNPYADTAIETCCTVAWMALTVDYLRLTGDPAAADDLELATLNGGLGAQHPSGRWWTYNTPMNGVREASAHTIVFQSRAGTPELNCCSVNAPRVLGSLSDWALMTDEEGLVLNWLGAGRLTGMLRDGTRVSVTSSDDAWRTGSTALQVESSKAGAFHLRIRMPRWSSEPNVRLNDGGWLRGEPGSYLSLHRAWTGSDRLTIQLGISPRYVAGANEMAGRVSVYYGPLLLAYDQAWNGFDEAAIPPIDLSRLAAAQATVPAKTSFETDRRFLPWLSVDAPAKNGGKLRLVDFASAGATGTHYRSWLPAEPAPPAPILTQIPPDAGHVPPGDLQFRWRGPRGAQPPACRVEFSRHATFNPVLFSTNLTGRRLTLNSRNVAGTPENARETTSSDTASSPIYWRVVSVNEKVSTLADVPPAWFVLDPSAAPQPLPAEVKTGPGGELVLHALRGDVPPQFGELKPPLAFSRGVDGAEVNGRDQLVRYALSAWPDDDFTAAVRVQLTELPQGRVGQVFSAWCAAMDDPLRLVVDNGKLHARIEAGASFSTPGTPVVSGRWYAVAAVKQGTTLRLFVDGKEVGACAAPAFSTSGSQECALGGNPRFGGNECLAARFSDFRLYSRALDHLEVQTLAARP